MGMALTSPGVEVTVIDESFYTPAAPGTVPLIVVATGQDKSNGAGTGTAAGTLAANVGTVYRVSSQKELNDIFGVPFFEKTASSTPIHGAERNEYGLLSAYSLLGVSNSAFIVRADVDLNELEGSADAPGAAPDDGQWWVDTNATAWGIQEWNGAAISTTGGQRFTNKTPIVLTDDDATKIEASPFTGQGRRPKGAVGSIGDYAVVFETVDGSGSFTASRETARFYYKSAGNTQVGVNAGDWVLVGSNEWRASWPTVIGSVTVTGTITAGSFTINDTTVTVTEGDTLDDLVATINGLSITGVSAKNVSGRLYLYSNGEAAPTVDPAVNAIRIADNTQITDALGLTTGTNYGVALQQTPHTSVPEWKTNDDNPRPTGSVWVKTTEPNLGSRWRVKEWDSASSSFVEYSAPLYASTHAALYGLDRSGGGANIPADSIFVQTNAFENDGFDSSPQAAVFRVWYRWGTGNTTITSSIIASGSITAGENTFQIQESDNGSQTLSTAVDVSFTAQGLATDAFLMAEAINAAGLENVVASITDDNRVQIDHTLGGDIRFIETSQGSLGMFAPFNINTGTGTANFYNLTDTGFTGGQAQLSPGADSSLQNVFLASNWQPLAAQDFVASSDSPTNEPDDGQLWYNPEFSDADIMIHNGTTWVGYQNFSTAYADTNATGPIVSASEPTTQTDGSALVDGDLWISTADIDNFPVIYRYNGDLLEFVQLDKTDQTTEEGILFADARYGLSGATGATEATIVDLLTNNFLDPDAPDPALYPKGMLLFNTRRSGGNVKRYENNYIDITADNARFNDEAMSGYATDRWVTASPNQEDGSGSFGRIAQRAVVTAALKSAVDTNQQIRDTERRNFNLIACPGYPELMSNLVNLNIDRGLTAFVIGDTPLRLSADSTTLNNYGTNAALVTDNNDDGIVTRDEYLGVFYPSGFTTDLSGSNAVVPSSHMMLRTIALSDNVSFPWFAPAGTRRGGITNATSVGYIDADTGEFQTIALNEGQRDVLYENSINPIVFFTGAGLLNFGQKTRARNASALDRINVARLVVFLRTQLDKLARPYIFEPNDKITRDEIKQAVESLLLELVGLRAIYDFAVVCDETNNTPARIDRNELYVDIAIEPVKAVEFIYIPLRVQNTGEI